MGSKGSPKVPWGQEKLMEPSTCEMDSMGCRKRARPGKNPREKPRPQSRACLGDCAVQDPLKSSGWGVLMPRKCTAGFA